MTSLLLYAHTESTWVIILQWGAGVLLLVLLLILIFVQRRSGKRLQGELEALEKIRKGNVEYDFVLKAMKIAVWRYDSETMSFLYEKDYRDGSNNYVPAPNENYQDALGFLVFPIGRKVMLRLWTAMQRAGRPRLSVPHNG